MFVLLVAVVVPYAISPHPLSFMDPPPPPCSPSLPSLLSGSLLCWSLLSGVVVRR